MTKLQLQKDPPVNQPMNLLAMGRGLLIALALTIVFSLIFTLLLHFSSLSEKVIPWITVSILLLSVFFGSALAAARAGTKGLFHGLGVGLGFFILIWVLGTLLFSGPLNPIGLLEKMLLTVAAGALGGILGVTLSD